MALEHLEVSQVAQPLGAYTSNFVVNSSFDGGPTSWDSGVITLSSVNGYTKGTLLGEFQGKTLANAFSNPSGVDLLQVINRSGAVVYKINSTGVETTNPATWTKGTILGTYEGSAFAEAFLDNPYNLDLFQVVPSPYEPPIFIVNAEGVAS